MMPSRGTDAEPAGETAAGSGKHQSVGDVAILSRPRRPFGGYLTDELDLREALYRWFIRQPDLHFPDETRALFRVWLDDIAEERRFGAQYNIAAPGPAYNCQTTSLRISRSLSISDRLPTMTSALPSAGGR